MDDHKVVLGASKVAHDILHVFFWKEGLQLSSDSQIYDMLKEP
jgi:hypothetical protein